MIEAIAKVVKGLRVVRNRAEALKGNILIIFLDLGETIIVKEVVIRDLEIRHIITEERTIEINRNEVGRIEGIGVKEIKHLFVINYSDDFVPVYRKITIKSI